MEKPWCNWCSGEGCNQCRDDDDPDYAAEYDYDDDWQDDYPDEFQFDCGRLPDGTCMHAGTEDCDWECPYRLEQLKRWNASTRYRNWADNIHRHAGNSWHLIRNLRRLRRMKCECGKVEWTVYSKDWLCPDCVPF